MQIINAVLANERLTKALTSCGQVVMYAVGLICVSAANVLIMGLSFIWYSKLLPALMDMNSVEGLVHLGLSSFLTFNALFNHYHAATCPPGEPEDSLLPPISPQECDMKKQNGEMWARFCKTCYAWKPPRAHHCHFCGKCVLKMDHHCPWINGCVGHHNQKYFMNMLLYIFLATGHVCAIILLYYAGLIHPVVSRMKLQILHSLFTTELLLCGSLFVMMGFFIGWNGLLLVTNQTVIEFYGNIQSVKEAKKAGREWKSPFDLGWWRNMQEVCGGA